MADPEPNESVRARARVIAGAFGRTADYHRRTALLAGMVALGACALALFAGSTEAKGVALLIAVAFGAAAYRSLTTANRYLDPARSPVLQAITKRPADIARVTHDKARALLVIRDASGNELLLRLDASTPAEPLLDAFAAHAPHADVER